MVRSTADPTYNSWKHMKDRCFNANDKMFYCYGARGITVCERWLQFDGFFADMGPCPTGAWTLERVNVNEDYRPGNCIWMLRKYQNANRRPGWQHSLEGKANIAAGALKRKGANHYMARRRAKES